MRVAYYAQQMEREVRLVARSCNVDQPRQANRGHARVVQASGLSMRCRACIRDRRGERPEAA